VVLKPRLHSADTYLQLAAVSAEVLVEKHIRKAYKAALEGYKEKKRQQAQEAVDESFLTFEELKQSDKMDIALLRARRYSRRLGLAPQDDPRTTGVFFVNGKLFPMNEVSSRNQLHMSASDALFVFRAFGRIFSRPCKCRCSI
jgi:hypothetical protein